MYKAMSLGWGVQSWTMAAMIALGDLEMVDVAIHSDTRHERAATYAFAAEWTPWLEAHGIRVATVVNTGKGGTDIVVTGTYTNIPAFTRVKGKKGQIRRQCTGRWKIAPIRRYLQKHRDKQRVELWLGISTDEFQRAKDADRKYITHRFPLLELGMSRADCLQYLADHDLPAPVKSSCVFCPYMNKAAWEEMRVRDDGDWQHAVEVDAAIRDLRPPGQLFVHPKRIPLNEAVAFLLQTGQISPIELLDSDDLDAECDSGHCFL